MIYLLIIFWLIVLVYIYDYRGAVKKRLLCYNITTLILILLAGLRYRIGSDTLEYELSFNSIPSIDNLTWRYIFESSNYEVGFTIFMSLIKSVFGSFWCFLLIQSSIINFCVCRFFKESTKNIFIAVLIYFIVLYYFINCEAARQGVALAILLNSWSFFVDKKWTKSVMLIIIASMFHSSALIFLILPILKLCRLWDKLRPNIWSCIIILSIVITSYFVQQFVSQTFLQYFVEGDFGGRVNAYYGDAHELSGISLLTQVVYVLFYVVTPFLCLKRMKNEYHNYENIAPVLILCSIFCVASGIPMVYRLTYYFMPFYFVMFSENLSICQPINGKYYTIEGKSCDKIVILSILLMFLLYKIQPYFYEDGSASDMRYYMRFYPYNSVIEKGIDINREELYRGI